MGQAFHFQNLIQAAEIFLIKRNPAAKLCKSAAGSSQGARILVQGYHPGIRKPGQDFTGVASPSEGAVQDCIGFAQIQTVYRFI